jgi:hypothetical protein
VEEFYIFMTQGGLHTVTWFATIEWEGGALPTLDSQYTDVFKFISIDGGSYWMGMKMAAGCHPVA